MILPLIVLLLGLQDNSAEISAQRAEISRLQGEVQRITSELQKTQAALENEQRPFCSSQSRLQTNTVSISDASLPIRLNLFAIVSTPTETCLPADIRLTATFQDSSGGFVCSGTVTFVQTLHIQNTQAELRPYDSEAFLKWWDGPTLRQQALVCRDYKGDEVRSPTDQATSLHIYATAFPKRGGLSTSEFQVILPRFARP